MAFIYKSEGSPDTRCALSRADFGRQRDVYILAKRKDASCRRLWNEFQAEQPEMARLVVADVESEKQKDVAANRHLDLVLKAEKLSKPKKAKLTKAEKREIRSYAPSRDDIVNMNLQNVIRTSPSGAEREAARAALNARGVPA